MKRGRHPDGRYGLYFNVIGNSRTWVQRLTIDGKRRNFGLGPWPVVSLSEAREIAFDNVRKRHRGIDPIAERSRAAAMPTFAEALDSCIALRADGWKAGSRNEANWRSSLAHAAPLANRAVDTIASDDVVGIVTALLRAGKAPTARSVRQRIRLVFDWCIAQGHRTDNPANDAIDALLPSSGHKTKHRESVAVADVAQVVAKIETTAHASRLGAGMALRFLVLTAARTSEAIGARWSEIDLDHATWTIPAARMKGGEAHRVLLAEAAVAVLAKARARWGAWRRRNEWVERMRTLFVAENDGMAEIDDSLWRAREPYEVLARIRWARARGTLDESRVELFERLHRVRAEHDRRSWHICLKIAIDRGECLREHGAINWAAVREWLGPCPDATPRSFIIASRSR